MAGTAREMFAEWVTLPLGRKVSRGTVRWYLVRCHKGKELSTCNEVARLVPEGLLLDCFVPRKEQGSARDALVPLFRGYFIVATGDAPALAKELALLTVFVQMVGQMGCDYAPVDREAQEFLTKVMDRRRVIRRSQATVDTKTNRLHVVCGPLVGQEARIRDFDARSQSAQVVVGDDAQDGRSFSVTLPVDIQVGTMSEDLPRMGRVPAKPIARTSLPLGCRTPRGRLRWYFVACPEGSEARMCEAVRGAISPAVLAEAYVPKVEHPKKVHGSWTKPVQSLVNGCFAVATTDSVALKAELEKTGLPLRLVGQGKSFQPLDDDAWGLVESCMDGTRTIRESRGEIVGDRLRVWSGPLAGRESLVSHYVRRKSLAFVDLGSDQAGDHALVMPLAIVARR